MLCKVTAKGIDEKADLEIAGQIIKSNVYRPKWQNVSNAQAIKTARKP